MTRLCDAVRAALGFRACVREIGGCGSCYGALAEDVERDCPPGTMARINRVIGYNPADHSRTWNAWTNRLTAKQADAVVIIVQRSLAGRSRRSRRAARRLPAAAAASILLALAAPAAGQTRTVAAIGFDPAAGVHVDTRFIGPTVLSFSMGDWSDLSVGAGVRVEANDVALTAGAGITGTAAAYRRRGGVFALLSVDRPINSGAFLRAGVRFSRRGVDSTDRTWQPFIGIGVEY